MANCQQFAMTANRNNIRTANDEYNLATPIIVDWCKAVKDVEFSQSYFGCKKREDDDHKRVQDDKARKEREQRTLDLRQDRINSYKGRADLITPGLIAPPIKEPRQRGRNRLLLQSMISSRHPGIDFIIGDYSTARGVDFLVERKDKGFISY